MLSWIVTLQSSILKDRTILDTLLRCTLTLQPKTQSPSNISVNFSEHYLSKNYFPSSICRFYSLTMHLHSIINDNFGHEISYLSELMCAIFSPWLSFWETPEFCVKICKNIKWLWLSNIILGCCFFPLFCQISHIWLFTNFCKAKIYCQHQCVPCGLFCRKRSVSRQIIDYLRTKWMLLIYLSRKA